MTQGDQQRVGKISAVNKLQTNQHILLRQKYESLQPDAVMDHLASFDRPDSRKHSAIEEQQNQIELRQLLVTETFPIICTGQSQPQSQTQQPRDNTNDDKNLSMNFASSHALLLNVRESEATTVKDVACQCVPRNDHIYEYQDDCGNYGNVISSRNYTNNNNSASNSLRANSLSHIKVIAPRKRQTVTFSPSLNRMKLSNGLESDTRKQWGVILGDNSFLSTWKSDNSNNQKPLECCTTYLNASLSSSEDTNALAATVSDIEEHATSEDVSATPTIASIKTKACHIAVSPMQRVVLSGSLSDSQLANKTSPAAKSTFPSHETRCKAVDELSHITADIAAENPDMIRFQQVLNSWISAHTGAQISAFLLISKECNSCFCQGNADVLGSLFHENAPFRDKDDLSPPPYTPHAPNVYANIDMLTEELQKRIGVIVKKGFGEYSVPVHPLSGTLFLLQARNNFLAALLLIHQNESVDIGNLALLRTFPISKLLLDVKSKSMHSFYNHKVESERLLIIPHLHLIATLLSIVANVEEQKRLARQSELFLTMAQNVFSSLQDMNLLVRNITKEAKTLVHAEICSLFLLERENSELVAEVFEKNGSNDEYLTEIRLPLSLGIVGQVATTGEMMNVKEAYSHPAFYRKVDERTGFVTRNILCFPIKDTSGNLVGVAELCNKIGKPAFTKHDEQIAMTFAVYCAISISHCLLYRKLQEAHRRSHLAAELLVQGSTLSIAPEDLLRLTVGDIPTATSYASDFDHFYFSPRSIGTGDTYVEAALSIFQDLGFVQRFRLQRRTLACFLLMVQKSYRDVPYHNWSHAFAVSHFTYLLLRTETAHRALSELENFALLVASLCHDIDHRGTTNAFQVQSRTPLAQLYSSEGSVLERHHFAQTISILNMEECNIFVSLNRAQFHSVLDHIREIILATDIANHLQKVEDIKRMTEVGFDCTIKHHRYLLLCLMMTSADLSDQTKDFRNSKAIAENIYKEFFSQGDLEKQMGNRPLEMMDRDRACVPKLQLEFMDTIAVPVFEYLSQLLPESKSTYESMLFNRKCWQALGEILAEEEYPATGLEYLKDIALEERVIERAQQ
ncbi:unnamed protein product [Thelazia callipaeda]|uniref:Phosphodiesterase n=1 Tax=Thelazia callipaeda TaxID=103827 RepID=A0A0N5D768_THECL|nr:unnamed protein product [Thelazia callipaeda]